MEMDDIGAVGAYGMPHALQRRRRHDGDHRDRRALSASSNYKARTRSVYVNKNLIGMYRGVGMPLACVATELLTDLAADKLGIDTVEFKRRTYRPKSSLPCVTPGGQRLETVSFHECLDKLVALMDYDALRKEQRELRERGVYRGIGIATFCEQTAYGPPYYGPSGASISTQDGCTLRLEPSGSVRCITSLTDQGQGTLTSVAQIVADTLGVSIDQVSVMGGDSAISPYGGGAWASRGTAIGGEAALRAGADAQAEHPVAGRRHRADARRCPRHRAGPGHQHRHRTEPSSASPTSAASDISGRTRCRRTSTCSFRSPRASSATTRCTTWRTACRRAMSRSTARPASSRCSANGRSTIAAASINPLLVDEQVRGGIVQGIGAVLFEECIYSDDANLLNGTMADYLVPMAFEMPDIVVGHVETPETSTKLGAKGIGEAGLIGAMGAVWVAVNDALKPLGAKVLHQPFTPERVLDALARAQSVGSGPQRTGT